MNRRRFAAIALGAAVVVILFVPSIGLELFCGTDQSPDSALVAGAYTRHFTVSLVTYLAYLYNGERMIDSEGISCGPEE